MLPPGGYLTARAGTGSATASTFYWGSGTPMFGNISSPAVAGDLGDGVYLFDPQGDIRSHSTYPCVPSCADTAAGRVTIDPRAPTRRATTAANPRARYIAIAATGSPVDLTRKVLVVNGHVMELPVGSVLQPGERLQVRSGAGTLEPARPLLAERRPAAQQRRRGGPGAQLRGHAAGLPGLGQHLLLRRARRRGASTTAR